MGLQKTLAALCILVLLVFAGVLLWTNGAIGLSAEAGGLPATHAAFSTILTADGGDPLPKPIPLPHQSFA